MTSAPPPAVDAIRLVTYPDGIIVLDCDATPDVAPLVLNLSREDSCEIVGALRAYLDEVTAAHT